VAAATPVLQASLLHIAFTKEGPSVTTRQTGTLGTMDQPVAVEIL